MFEILHVPTVLIVCRPSCRHLFGKLWWNKTTHRFLKGDKTIKQKMRELEEKGLTDNDFYKMIKNY